MKNKKLLSLFIICIFIFNIIGCSGSKISSSSKNGLKIFVSCANIDSFRKTIVDQMQTSAKEENIKLDVESANNDKETQLASIEKAKGGNYDVFVCMLVDADSVNQVIKAIGDKPIIFINCEPDQSKLKKDKYIYLSSDDNEVVDLTAKYLEKKFESSKTINAVIFQGDKSSKSTKIRTDYLKNRLLKDGYTVNTVFEDYADWGRDSAKDMFNTFLKLNKSYDCIIANNDDMALGVIDAMKEHKIDPASVPILGVDAVGDACQAIIDGEMSFSIKQSGENQAKSALEAAKLLSAGKSIKGLKYAKEDCKYVWVPYTAVDKNNAAQFKK